MFPFEVGEDFVDALSVEPNFLEGIVFLEALLGFDYFPNVH